MTNEELVIRIQDGESDLYTQLWENTKYLLFRIMRSKLIGTRIPAHITVEDLQQEMFFALIKAVNYYDRDKYTLFSSYLTYPVLTVLNNTVYRDKSPTMEESYNEPITDDDGKTTERIEFIIDAKSEESFYDIELNDLQLHVRQAVAALKERERAAVSLKFFHNCTEAEIAERLDVSLSRAGQLLNNGLSSLRRNRDILNLRHETIRHKAREEVEYAHYADEWKYSLERIQTEIELSKRLDSGEYISYGKQIAFIERAKSRYISAKLQDIAETRRAFKNSHQGM